VATHVDPEILIIDEILAVGDEHFSRKSKAKLNEFREQQKTIFLVTHDLGSLQRWCDQAAWIEDGRVRMLGEPAQIVAEYRHAVQDSEAEADAKLAEQRAKALKQPRSGPPAEPGRRWGSFAVELERVRVLGADRQPRELVEPGEPLALELKLRAHEPVGHTRVRISLTRGDGLLLWKSESPLFQPRPGVEQTFRLELPRLGLAGGDYWLNFTVEDEEGAAFDVQREVHMLGIRGSSNDQLLLAPTYSWELGNVELSPAVRAG
jgi:lipopolysaccharide transport system ATP-binding protein